MGQGDLGRGRRSDAVRGAAAFAVLLGGLLSACSGPAIPEAAQAWKTRGEASEAADHPDSALATYREAARRYPTEAWPWAGVGRACALLGRFPEADEAFRAAVRWDSTLVDERVELARLALAEGRPDEALGWLDGADAHRREDATRAALRARAFERAGRHGEAEAALDRAPALAPDDPVVLGAAALARLEADSADVALAALDEALGEHPRSAALHEDRAEVLGAQGDSAACVGELQRTLELDPRRPRARRRLAELRRAVATRRSRTCDACWRMTPATSAL